MGVSSKQAVAVPAPTKRTWTCIAPPPPNLSDVVVIQQPAAASCVTHNAPVLKEPGALWVTQEPAAGYPQCTCPQRAMGLSELPVQVLSSVGIKIHTFMAITRLLFGLPFL